MNEILHFTRNDTIVTEKWNAIYVAAGLRGLAIGLVSVYLGLDLARRNMSAASVGLIIGAGLLGNTVSAILVGALGAQTNRRTLLVFFSLLMACGGIVLSFPLPLWLFATVAALGLLNGMGKDRSGLRALDQTILPETVSPRKRTLAFAIYNVVVDASGALGAGLAVLPSGYATYALIIFASAIAYFWTPDSSKAPKPESVPSRLIQSRPSSNSKKKIWNLASLFFIDSLGGGFLTSALITYWFFIRFHPSSALIASLFVVARILNALSHFGAVWLAKRIGLVRTMIYTHLPGSLALITAAFAPTLTPAIVFFLVRESLIQMDVPARESYVMAIVPEDERPFAAGLTTTTRNLGWTITPFVGGTGMALISPSFALVVGSALKIGYDMLLYIQFRNMKPTEESN